MLKKLSVAALSLLAIAGLYTFLLAPFFATKALESAIQQLALTEINLPKPNTGLNRITYTDIALDKDKINIAKSLYVTASPLSFATRHIDNLSLNGLEIIGSLAQDNSIIIDGINLENLSPYAILNKTSAGRVQIRNAEISLITDDYGLITTKIDLLLHKKDKHSYALQGRFDSQQKDISFTGNFKGTITQDELTADIELLAGKITIPSYSTHMSRMSGLASLSYQYKAKALTLKSSINAGGLRIAETPWHNATLSFKINNEEGRALQINATALNSEQTELALLHEKEETIGVLRFPDLNTRSNFILSNKIDPATLTLELQNHTAYFKPESNNALVFKLGL